MSQNVKINLTRGLTGREYLAYTADMEDTTMEKTYKLTIRITPDDQRKLAAQAGPHGSLSSVVRWLIATLPSVGVVGKARRQ